MTKPFFRAVLEIEGVCPQNALNKLANRGVFVYGVCKISPIRLKFRVKYKDLQKVFAIFRGSCYTVTDKGTEGAARVLFSAFKRPCALLGAALFVLLCVAGNAFIFRIDVSGCAAYRKEVALEVLRGAGVRVFAPLPQGGAEESKRALLSMPGVVFAEVRKSGGVLKVTIEEENVVTPSYERELFSPCVGVLEELTVLRGTPLVSVGSEVSQGQPLVGGYFLTEEGEKKPTFAVARASVIKTHSCEYTAAEKSASALRDAVAAARLSAGGEAVSSQVSVREEGGAFVYTVVLRVRVRCSVNLGGTRQSIGFEE